METALIPSTPATPHDGVSRRSLIAWAIVIALAYALLWSTHWYPLSDSALYLSLGRSVANGRGLSMMGDPVRLVPPLTPCFLGMLMKLGAGIGAIQAAMIALMLASHYLCFLTLRRWTNERLALGATIGCALSYWVFANAFTIMSEPLCIALMWGGFLALSHVNNESPWRWALVLLACGLLLLAAANRDAALCLLPGPLLALLIKCRWSRQSMAWLMIFVFVFTWWFFYRHPEVYERLAKLVERPAARSTQPAPPVSPVSPVVNPEVVVEGDVPVREGRYKPTWMIGVPRDHRLLTEPPVLGGRWVLEGMMMASVGAFESKNETLRVLATTVALLAFALAITGGIVMLLRGHAWVLGPALYFAAIWLQWGTRIKPRYMIPIAPILLLFLWHGLTWALLQLLQLRKGSKPDAHRVGRCVMGGLIAIVIAGNAFPWAMEFWIRHGSSREFYDNARRGAYAQLVDIGAHIQKNVPADQSVWTNVGAHRRIAYFLGGRKIETNELPFIDWKDVDALAKVKPPVPATAPTTLTAATKPATTPATQSGPPPRRRAARAPERRKRFFFDIDEYRGNYLIILVENPTPDRAWPAWHWPMRADDAKVEWWRLYERQSDDTWKRIQIPRSRDYVRNIPPASK